MRKTTQKYIKNNSDIEVPKDSEGIVIPVHKDPTLPHEQEEADYLLDIPLDEEDNDEAYHHTEGQEAEPTHPKQNHKKIH